MRSIVERDDHYIARPEGREKNLCDIGFEPVAPSRRMPAFACRAMVDRTVEPHGRDHAVQAEAGEQHRRLADALRNRHQGAFTPGAAPMRARHVRRRPGLVRRPAGGREAICREGMKTRRLGSRSGWLSNQSRRFFRTSGRSCSTAGPVFFARQAVSLEEARKRGGRRGDAALGQAGAEFLEALVSLLLERRHDDSALRLDPTRPHVAALRLRRTTSQRITDDTETPKRPAAARRPMPPSTAASARALTSIESGLPIPPPRYPPQEQKIRPEPIRESSTAIQIGRATL